MPPAPVKVQPVQATQVPDASEFVARLISRQSVTLRPQVPGQIRAISVKAGDFVHKGQRLMVIDPIRQAANVRTAIADAAVQQAKIGEEQKALAALKSQRQALLSAVETAQAQFRRYETLYAQQSVSQQEFERYRDEYNRAQATLQANQAQIDQQAAVVVGARRDFARSQASIGEQKAQLSYFYIDAPFSGQVGDVPVKVGNYVQPMDDLMSVTDNKTLELNVNVPAELAMRVRQGLPVELLDLSGQVLRRSSIGFVSPRVDETSQTLLVKALISNPDGLLKADQVLNARVIWRQAPGILIPTSAVNHLGGRDFVYLMEPKSPQQAVARQVPVELGDIQGPNYVVKTGLKPGQNLIVSGLQKLADGAPVIPLR
jgi:RND family efflux transporter MFP subunit